MIQQANIMGSYLSGKQKRQGQELGMKLRDAAERSNAMEQATGAMNNYRMEARNNALAMYGGPTKEAAAAERNALDIAGQAIGLNETDKKAALQEYLQNGGQSLDPATTAWCAAFVDATLQQSGVEGTGKLNARSYLDWGEEVDTPQIGDVAVFSRGDPNGWQGHVGFYAGEAEDGSIRVLGGNQSDGVNYSNYSRDRLLGFRRAPGAQRQANPMAQMSRPQMPTFSPYQIQGNAMSMLLGGR